MSAPRKNPRKSPGSAGYDLIDEKKRLEEARPEIVTSYQSFRESFTQFRQVEKQFAGKAPANRSLRPAPMGRFR